LPGGLVMRARAAARRRLLAVERLHLRQESRFRKGKRQDVGSRETVCAGTCPF
jgi:hypothetical protein